jgi:hypothetical protein
MAVHSTAMERVGRILARWKRAPECVDPAMLARAAWRIAAGEKVAAQTVEVRLVRRHLVVEVRDEVWRRQLLTLRPFLLANLKRELGEGAVEDIELRLACPRKTPGRVLQSQAAAPPNPVPCDEADSIADPVFGALYRARRRRSTG